MAESGGGDENDDDKPHEPTQRRRDEARRKGDIARSQDLSTALAYGGLALGLWFAGAAAVDRLGLLGIRLLTATEGFGVAGGEILREVLFAIGPVLGLPLVLALVAAAAQGQIVFAWSKLEPKLSKISLVSNAQQKYGRKGLFEFLKNLTKLALVALTLALYASGHLGDIGASFLLPARQAIQMMLQLSGGFLIVVVVVTAAIAAVDFVFQVSEWQRRNRMSHRELRDEMKETEGDPYMKSERRRRGQEIVGRSTIEAVQKADVVVVNPEHFAVALAWDQAVDEAPRCVAKGQDAVALRIREIAQEAGVPIRSDPPTARALYAALEVGDEVQPEFYRPVAAAIRFAEALRRRRAGLGIDPR